MADELIFIDSFGKYVEKHNVTYETYAGSPSLYLNNAALPMADQGLLKEYLSADITRLTNLDVITGPGAVPFALYFEISDAQCGIRRSLPANYTRVTVGVGIKSNLGSIGAGIILQDAGSSQLSLWVDTSGRLRLDRGAINSTNLFTSAAIFLSGVRHYVELDATIHPSAGTYQIWVDGVSITSASSQNTRATANSFVNQFFLGASGNNTPPGNKGTFDSFYIADNTGGTRTALGDRVVDGLAVTADSSVQFTPSLTVVGKWYQMRATTAGNAPGAAQIALMPVTPEANCTLNSIGLMPRATSAGAKFKGVVYSDNAGAPGSLLSDGTEAVGAVSGTALSLPLVTPQALTGGTQYWIGYYTDTSVVIQISDNNTTVGQRKSNTYASGAPAGPLAGMTTAQSSWAIWGSATSSASNFPQADAPGIPIVSGTPIAYNQDATVGHIDRFTVQDLSATPTVINTVQISVAAQRSDAGARTMNIRGRHSGTSGNGDNAGITPATTMQFYSTRLKLNPSTSAAWAAAEVNAMFAEIEVAT